MKGYYLFAGDWYYASGGWRDFVGWYDGLDLAKAAYRRETRTWGHIVNVFTRETVCHIRVYSEDEEKEDKAEWEEGSE